ncbi:MAG TPA: hypothetical protein PKA64_04640, partial [Myxococcota bacterium]|nr:hypothetical protein [Myxococcota bacterium]
LAGEHPQTIALILAHLDPALPVAHVEQLLTGASAGVPPGIALQAIALAWRPDLDDRWRGAAVELAGRLDRGAWDMPREVWSVSRCVLAIKAGL